MKRRTCIGLVKYYVKIKEIEAVKQDSAYKLYSLALFRWGSLTG